MVTALDPTDDGAVGHNSALLHNVLVANAAGLTLARCTPPWLAELGRKTIPAPSPPPPVPPTPPAAPPRVFGGGSLVLEDFVNVSNAASVALGVLMKEAQGTITTAVTAAAAAAVAASAGGAASGGAAGGRGVGGAVGAVQGAQRLGNIAKLGGPPPDGNLGDGGGWTSGRLGFGRGGGGGRRRLQSRGGGGSSSSAGSSSAGGGGGATAKSDPDPVADGLMDQLYDLFVTVSGSFAPR